MTSQLRILKAAFFTPGLNGRWGLPMILWGDPGIAKTSMIRALALECGLAFNDTIASICEPADLAGYPIPDMEAKMVRPLPPPWIHEVNAKAGVVQLFDEATSCSSAAHAALMRISLEGKAGDVDVDPRVRFIMAANPVECAANANELAVPLANRFGHMKWNPGEADDWVNWLLGGGANGLPEALMSAEDQEAAVMERWDAEFTNAAGLVGSFIRKRGSTVLHKMPDVNDTHASMAWPSRRTWEMATRAIAGGRIAGLSEAEIGEFVTCFVGTGPASELIGFMKNLDLPDIEKLLDGKEKFKHKKTRLDRTLVVLNQAAAFLVAPIKGDTPKEVNANTKLRNTRVDAFWQLTCDILKGGSQDLVIPSARLMIDAGLDTRLNKSGPAREAMLLITPTVRKTLGVA